MATAKPTGTAKKQIDAAEAEAKPGTVSQLRKSVDEAQKKTVEVARETYDEVSEKARDVVEEVQVRAELAGGEFERNVRANPALAVGAAVGVGFLLGLAVRGIR